MRPCTLAMTKSHPSLPALSGIMIRMARTSRTSSSLMFFFFIFLYTEYKPFSRPTISIGFKSSMEVSFEMAYSNDSIALRIVSFEDTRFSCSDNSSYCSGCNILKQISSISFFMVAIPNRFAMGTNTVSVSSASLPRLDLDTFSFAVRIVCKRFASLMITTRESVIARNSSRRERVSSKSKARSDAWCNFETTVNFPTSVASFTTSSLIPFNNR
mmetsp:Transcript_5813/g.17092  ORF Transcript_5813/g.17092 Transcript_5813/m.17092 type:complete len:214 (-) Transcript_5813:1191-1832(-)